ncbi:MAG: hypothetical protein K9I71_03610 [Ignavibacteriales bacterium]|nr:hypothetical protein [Ignavibacteriales bacterium]MCF8435823.1 hypothetical protein [Ignavibacteriales bacterium]
MLRTILVIFIGISGVFAQDFPDWFLKQGDYPGIVVGYSTNAFINDSSYAYARKDAACNMAAFSRVQISGERAYTDTEAGFFYVKDSFREYFDCGSFTGTAAKMAAFDSVQMADYVIIALDRNGIEGRLLSGQITKSGFSKPAWLDSLPADAEYIYARGDSEPNLFESDAWKNAEKRGRIRLAQQKGGKFRELTRKDVVETAKYKSENIDVIISGIEVTGRYFDPSIQKYFVLLRMKD